MNSRFSGLALVLATLFLTTFVVLLWLVQRLFKSRGWHDLGTPARPFRVRSRVDSRVIGFVFALVGCGFLFWSWHDAHTGRFFSFKMAAGGPTFLGIGAAILIKAPLTPDDDYPIRPSILTWILTGLGLALGWLYSRYLETGRLPFVP